MVQNIFLQAYYRFIQYLYQLTNTLKVLVAPLKVVHENVKERQKKY